MLLLFSEEEIRTRFPLKPAKSSRSEEELENEIEPQIQIIAVPYLWKGETSLSAYRPNREAGGY